jgi:hypothetical protein
MQFKCINVQTIKQVVINLLIIFHILHKDLKILIKYILVKIVNIYIFKWTITIM